MPSSLKSAPDQLPEAKAQVAGIPDEGKGENAPNKPTGPPANRELPPGDDEPTGRPGAKPTAASVVSDRQRAANKANAQKSTGPRTEAGKANVSVNALKHGLRSAKNPLDISTQIPGEQTQLTELLKDFDATYQPANPAELQLVAHLAQLTLRLNRAAAMESATLDQSRTDALESAGKFPSLFPDPDSSDFETALLASTFTRASAQLKLLSQYESRLSHDFARTLRQLLQLQKLRKQTQAEPREVDFHQTNPLAADDASAARHHGAPDNAPVQNSNQTNPTVAEPATDAEAPPSTQANFEQTNPLRPLNIAAPSPSSREGSPHQPALDRAA